MLRALDDSTAAVSAAVPGQWLSWAGEQHIAMDNAPDWFAVGFLEGGRL